MIKIIKEEKGIGICHMWGNRIDYCTGFLKLSHLQQIVSIDELGLYPLCRSGFVNVFVEIVFV